MHSFFLACSPAAEVVSLALSAAGQARRPSVHYDARLDPGRAPWRCSEHLTSLIWLIFSRGCVAPRRSSRTGASKTPYVFVNSPLPYRILYSLRFPARRATSSTYLVIVLPSLLAAATQQQQQQHFQTVFQYVCVCVSVYMWVGCVLS